MSEPDHTQFGFVELYTIMTALNTEYRSEAKHGEDCRRHVDHPDPRSTVSVDKWREWADASDERRAEIDAIVSKMPETIRDTWIAYRARDAAKAAARGEAVAA